MVHSVEEFLQVEVHHPFIPVLQMLLGLGDGRVTAAPGSETVATRVECRLVMRAEHLVHRLLHDSIDHVRNAKASLPARLGDPHAADFPRSVAAIKQPLVQRRQHPEEMLAHLVDALPVRTRSASIRRNLLERSPQILLARYLLHRHRRQGIARRVPRLRHRVRRRHGWVHTRSAVGPFWAVGCLAKQFELSCPLAGRGRLPSPLLRSGYDRLSPVFWLYATIRLLSSLHHVVLSFFTATARAPAGRRPRGLPG